MHSMLGLVVVNCEKKFALCQTKKVNRYRFSKFPSNPLVLEEI